MPRTGRFPVRRGRWGAGVLVALLLLGAAGCRQRPPDVLIILVDTLRADRLGAYGGPPGLTPFLDGLAASGVVFTNAYSTSSWTNPAIASLFTSRYPSQHQVTRFDSRLADAEVTLAERLGEAGWRRVGLVANLLLPGWMGYGQGFDAWFHYQSDRGLKIRAHRIAQAAIRFYDGQLAPRPWSRWTRRPLLLYLHFMEPHAPYEPPEVARRGRVGPLPPGSSEAAAMEKLVGFARWGDITSEEVAYLASLYDAEVATLDARLARLFARLWRRGLLDHTIVVVTADHGEEFREHGMLLHGSALYEETVRVPLIMTGPGLPAGRAVPAEVSLVDVAPTVLDLLGLPAEPRFEGRSLLPVLGGGERGDVVLELEPNGQRYDSRRHTAGIVHDRLKVLARGPGQAGSGAEAYDLARDPREARPDLPVVAEEAAALSRRLAQRRSALATRAGAAETIPIDDATRERLRALGYAQ